MARKRDIVEEILGKRQRLRRASGRRVDPFRERSIALVMALHHFRTMSRSERYLKQEMLRYVPVGLVALLEGYFRSTIRDLIDKGSPFRERAATLHEWRLDLPTLLRMESASVSAGEVVAHMVSLSSLEDINRHLSTILAIDFFAAARASEVFPNSTFGQAVPDAWTVLTGLFADRHVACHELNPRSVWTFKRATQQLRAAVLLRDAAEEVIQNALPVSIGRRDGKRRNRR